MAWMRFRIGDGRDPLATLLVAIGVLLAARQCEGLRWGLSQVWHWMAIPSPWPSGSSPFFSQFNFLLSWEATAQGGEVREPFGYAEQLGFLQVVGRV